MCFKLHRGERSLKSTLQLSENISHARGEKLPLSAGAEAGVEEGEGFEGHIEADFAAEFVGSEVGLEAVQVAGDAKLAEVRFLRKSVVAC